MSLDDLNLTALDPERTYLLIIDPATAPTEPEQFAKLLDAFHDAEIRCLVMVGDASIHPTEETYTEAAQRLLTEEGDDLDDDFRIHLAELLARAGAAAAGG